jgi:protein TonB
MRYPSIAKDNRIEGNVIVQFVVSKEGDIINAKIVRSLGGGIDQEALRVVKSMPRWNPGKHNGKAVPVTFTLPIKFTLLD